LILNFDTNLEFEANISALLYCNERFISLARTQSSNDGFFLPLDKGANNRKSIMQVSNCFGGGTSGNAEC